MNRVFLTTRLYGRVMKWDKESQIELDVLQSLIRDFGFDAVVGNSICARASMFPNADGNIRRMEFWMRVRGQYEHFSLEERAPAAFVLDT
jgi:hypothetical protein